MNSDEEVINNRMVFYIGLSMLFGYEIVYASNLSDLLRDFTNDNINEHFDLLRLIYKIRIKGNNVSFSEPANLREITIEEFNKIRLNFNSVNKYYNLVDQETVDKLSRLGELFAEYLNNFSITTKGLYRQ